MKEINICVCGSEAICLSNKQSSDLDNSGYAYVECTKCGLKISETTDKLGDDGFTLDSLEKKVIVSWNNIMKQD